MKLKCAWDEVSGKADKTNGASDVELKTHLDNTQQSHLLQAKILQGCLDTLVEKGLIEEAYLRGSLGRGHADEHSDIDLFSVIAPENLETAYDTVSDYLKSRGEIITSCHDRLVQDYGGIGFMFIARDAETDRTYQFDLYLAMKGVPPKEPVSIKPRMFAANTDYRWLNEYGNVRDLPLPPETEAFIRRHTAGETPADRLELLMQEIMITLYIGDKHTTRGQISRTMIDDNSMVASVIEMMQSLMPYKPTGYSCLYLGNEIAKVAQQYGDAEMAAVGARMEKLFDTPMSMQKMRETLDIAATILQQAAPERYENQKAAIAFMEKKLSHTCEIKPVAPKRPSAGAPGAKAA